MLDNIKALGFKYSTQGAITVSISDMTVPDKKRTLIRETEAKVIDIEKQYKRGFITNDERARLVIREWDQTTTQVTAELQHALDEYNPIYMMLNSGARGTMSQIRQMAGMRGLIANTSGKTIEIPIKSNYREGLSILEYFTASRGARKGLADTALRTADSGYLTRRLVDVSQDVIIREPDCGTTEGVWARAIEEKGQVVRTFADAIRGRFPVYDVRHPKTGEVLIPSTRMMLPSDAKLLEEAGVREVLIRTVLNCEAKRGVCARCYGMNLATGEPVSAGEAVGVIAAQSIGEPGTQLTMRTFHTGGVAGDDITQGLPRVEELFEARKPKKMAQLARYFRRRERRGDEKEQYIYDQHSQRGDRGDQGDPGALRRHKGQHRRPCGKGDMLTEGAQNPHDVLRILGIEACQSYLIQEVQKVTGSRASI
jgi:DNA-directed RNA polymerase subunit beta'